METLSPTLWDLALWARTAGSGAAFTAPAVPALGRRSSCVPAVALSSATGVKSLAELDAARQHRTFHLLIKPDILTCYRQSSN